MNENQENSTTDSIIDKPTPRIAKVQEQLPGPQKKSKKEEKAQKKDDKIVEQFLKSLNNLPTAEEKLSVVCRKYAEVIDENRRLKAMINQSDKKNAVLSKEKEQIQLDYNRTVLVKSKLENLCRELQKQNKAIKDDSLLKIKEEEERRKETQAKFQTTLGEITSLLQVNNDKNTKLRDDNINMTKKFKSVVEQYELREQQVDKMAKQMSLEQQLSEAKLAKANLEAQAEKERFLTEMSHLKMELNQCKAKIAESQSTEAALRSQIAIYTEKYDDFQNALVKSNKVFGGFKSEMDKMSKKIIKLEKEALSWKKRWEGSQVSLLEMATDKQQSDDRMFKVDRQVQQLQRLCRTMQSERTLLLKTLKDNNIEAPPLPTPPPMPAAIPPPSMDNSKVDAMAANCAQLKQSLAQLQTQLNTLTNNDQQHQEENQTDNTKDEQVQKQKTKKGKAKKSKIDKENIESLSNGVVVNGESCKNIEVEAVEKVDGKIEDLPDAVDSVNVSDSRDDTAKCNDTSTDGASVQLLVDSQ